MQEFFLTRWFLCLFLLSIISVQVWALLTSGYFFIWWLDIAMHLAGGLWVGMVAILFSRSFSFHDMVLFLLVLGAVALIGILWEFFEFGLNQIWESLGHAAFFQPSIEDTLGDLLADLLGGVAAFILFKESQKNI